MTREVFGAVLAAMASTMLIVPCAAEAQPLDIQVTTVRALEEGPCDPQLESLRPRLPLRFQLDHRPFEWTPMNTMAA